MSEVISFRLDRENPREAQAYQILDKWCAKGYSLRYIFTEALLELDSPGKNPENDQENQDIGFIINQISYLLEVVQEMKSDLTTRQDIASGEPILHDGFVSSIKQTVKPGIRL